MDAKRFDDIRCVPGVMTAMLFSSGLFAPLVVILCGT